MSENNRWQGWVEPVIRHVDVGRQLKWDRRFLRLALEVASWSKDTSTQVGSIIVGPDREILATGYNGPPRGVRDDVAARFERPAKYRYFAHAEENACVQGGGLPLLKGATLYLASKPTKLAPCATCTRIIIQSGIKRVVHEPAEAVARWAEEFAATLEMFQEAGITYDTVSLEDL